MELQPFKLQLCEIASLRLAVIEGRLRIIAEGVTILLKPNTSLSYETYSSHLKNFLEKDFLNGPHNGENVLSSLLATFVKTQYSIINRD